MAKRIDISELGPDTFGPSGNFREHVHYNRSSDCLEIWLSNRPSDAKRVDSVLTFYVDMDTEILTGLEIKGVCSLLKNYTSFRRAFTEKDHVFLEFILFVLHFESCQRELRPEEYSILKDTYNHLRNQVSDVEIEVSEEIRELALVT